MKTFLSSKYLCSSVDVAFNNLRSLAFICGQNLCVLRGRFIRNESDVLPGLTSGKAVL